MTADRAAPNGGFGFAADSAGARWSYSGALTCANAGAALLAAQALPLPASGEIDLGALGPIDSAAVAVLLALKRRGEAERRPLAFVNVPGALGALAQLYGVDDILVA
jgi:ABC-type transporter Mla MlaB component